MKISSIDKPRRWESCCKNKNFSIIWFSSKRQEVDVIIDLFMKISTVCCLWTTLVWRIWNLDCDIILIWMFFDCEVTSGTLSKIKSLLSKKKKEVDEFSIKIWLDTVNWHFLRHFGHPVQFSLPLIWQNWHLEQSRHVWFFWYSISCSQVFVHIFVKAFLEKRTNGVKHLVQYCWEIHSSQFRSHRKHLIWFSID